MAVNMKEEMLRTIRGEPTQRIPWVPRLDLWYRANSRAGTMPPGLKDATLLQLLDELEAGYHAVVPDYKADPDPDAELDRGLGLYNLSVMPYRTELRGVERRVTRQGPRTEVEYRTSVGTVRTAVVFDESMEAAGITLSHVDRYAIQSVEDYEIAGEIFENAEVQPNYEGYLAYEQQVGPRGLAAAVVLSAASPMHLIQRKLMSMERFFLEIYDHPAELARLAERVERYWQKVLDVVLDGPGQLCYLGANYDARITYPPFFGRHIQPWLRRAAELLHARGKYLLSHTDGENSGLLEHYIESDIDVADSVCPKPMTQLSLADVRQAFQGHDITIMGGVPSVALLPESMSEKDFDRFLDGFFDELGSGDHLILGVSDTTPPAADFNRLMKVASKIRDFGPVN